LIATTIIESGLDIPNANTIFINDAQNFGLSELHQLRGRVGRSNKKAFCFLFAPPLSSITNEARKRLKALEDFSDLGSGFNIAMQDMDIRGAGNLLGGEQSGFITDIGFDTYHRILNEAVNELKEEEDLKESFPEDDKEIRSKYPFHFIKDCLIDTDFEILFPEEYINNMSERIKLYRELDNIENENKLKEFENHLVDRFGQLPEPAKELLNIVRLRWIVQQMGFEKVLFKNNTLTAHFISDPHSLYFKSSIFKRILQFIQKQPALFRMKEHKNKLILSIKNTTSVSETIKILENILKE